LVVNLSGSEPAVDMLLSVIVMRVLSGAT